MPKRQKKKRLQGDKPDGKSKYTKKLAERRRAALKLGLPGNTPWPVIWAHQDK